MVTFSPCSGAHCILLCLVTRSPGQHSVERSCVPCPFGFLWLGGRTTLQPCPTCGTCTELPGLLDSKEYQWCLTRQKPSLQNAGYVFCPLGYFFTDRGPSCQPFPTVLGQCLQCPAGHFCPNRATQLIPSQPGTFSPHPGQDEATDCAPCPAGRACTQAGLPQPDAEYAPGYVCLVGSCLHTPRHACPPGTFSNRTNLSNLSHCEICPTRLACPRGE
ncbi:uncharacterized protein [Equus caballus]|uniref:uncharacterized protein n=1 Tax=Equus caballus TaxID=9796 RepID=UPI0038B29FBA